MVPSVIPAFILSLLFLLGTAFADDCTSYWERFSSEPYVEKAFPETWVTYWRYRFEISTKSSLGLQISGEFPHSRYMSFNVYDQNTMNPSGSLPDFRIEPDEHSSNPFINGVSRDVVERKYTVRLVPYGQPAPKSTNSNVLAMPKPIGDSKAQPIELWYRIYVPDQNTDEDGGVALPQIQSIDTNSGIPLECPPPKTVDASVVAALQNLPPQGKKGQVNFYRPPARALYSNNDNNYVAATISSIPTMVTVLRFQVPTFPNTIHGGGIFDDTSETRYWSLCMGGLSTKTSGCLADFEFLRSDDGFVNVVVGPSSLEGEVRAQGLNFLSRGKFHVPFIIYRNQLAKKSFAGNMDFVPKWSPEVKIKDDELFVAQKFIGTYSPSGRECSLRQFLSELRNSSHSLCGIQIK